MANVAFLGLGAMGYHMAGHLVQKTGHHVTVWNRTTQIAKACAAEFSCAYTQSLAQAVSDADFVFSCLGRDEDVREVLLAPSGALAHLKSGATLVDHTTTSAKLAKELGVRLDQANIAFMDGPVSGGEEGAKNGLLSCMLGGQAATLEKIQPLLDCYCKAVTLCGDTGAGQLTKMVNQICIAGVLQGLSEGIRFAEAEGLELETLLQAIGGGAAQSWQMQNRGSTMHAREFDFGFAIKWMIKDLGYCLDQAQVNGATLALAEQVHKSYLGLADAGHQNKDTSALILELDQDV